MPASDEPPLLSDSAEPVPGAVTKPVAAPCSLPRLRLLLLALAAVCVLSWRWHASRSLLQLPPPVPFTSGGAYEIRLCGGIRREGIGAVLSGLKPVLLLANATGAVISMNKDPRSGHGYPLRRYLRIAEPLRENRVPCALSGDQVHAIMMRIVQQCSELNLTQLQQSGVFRDCNLINVSRYLVHPRMCVARTAPLARQITKFSLHDSAPKDDVCVMRRGGDVERRIREGKGNVWAIDEELTIPILRRVANRGRRIVLVTETRRSQQVRELYRPDVFSNHERLSAVVSHLENCRCTFLAGGSSFASSMAQITKPTYIIYMTNRTGFEFLADPYMFDEYGDGAYPISAGEDRLTELCAP